ncbi:MAG: zinc-ribbon domain-containing protein [Thermodesulfobacteriota bacterium]|nr:zinc-ribbon domain-containing protein [Thermodesulfobacteriota bacterium]
MEITCDSCNANFVFSDEKIPQGRLITVTCPQCGGKHPIDTRNNNTSSFDLQDEIPIETFWDGDIVALLGIKTFALQESLVDTLKNMGYKTSLSENSTIGIEKLKFNQYNLIIIEEGFDDKGAVSLLNFVQKMPTPSRRETFVAIIGESFKTGDNFSAFIESANLVVNKDDIHNLKAILERSIHENELFYKVFKESLINMGKR